MNHPIHRRVLPCFLLCTCVSWVLGCGAAGPSRQGADGTAPTGLSASGDVQRAALRDEPSTDRRIPNAHAANPFASIELPYLPPGLPRAIADDGKVFVSGHRYDGAGLLWEVNAEGDQALVAEGHASAARYGRAGQLRWVTDAYVWTRDPAGVTRSIEVDCPTQTAALSADLSQLACIVGAQDGSLVLRRWNLSSDEEPHEAPLPTDTDDVLGLAVKSDGSAAVQLGGSGSAVRLALYPSRSGREAWRIEERVESRPLAPVFNEAEDELLVGLGRRVAHLDARTGQERGRERGAYFAVSENGRIAWMEESGRVRLVATGAARTRATRTRAARNASQPAPETQGGLRLFISPSGRRTLVEGRRSWSWLDETGQETVRHAVGAPFDIAASPSGDALAVRMPDRVMVFDIPSGELRGSFDAVDSGTHRTVRYSPDGRVIASLERTGHFVVAGLDGTQHCSADVSGYSLHWLGEFAGLVDDHELLVMDRHCELLSTYRLPGQLVYHPLSDGAAIRVPVQNETGIRMLRCALREGIRVDCEPESLSAEDVANLFSRRLDLNSRDGRTRLVQRYDDERGLRLACEDASSGARLAEYAFGETVLPNLTLPDGAEWFATGSGWDVLVLPCRARP